MFDLIFIARVFLLIVASIFGSYTDFRFRLIFDWFTYPLIFLGFFICVFSSNFFQIIFSVIFFVLLFFVYRLGKLGGGDVKFLVAVSLLSPFYVVSFLFSVLLVGSVSALIFISVFYSVKAILNGAKFNDFSSLLRAILFGIVIIFILFLYYLNGFFSFSLFLIFLFFSFFIILAIALEPQIKEMFFLKWKKLSELDDDEIIAVDFLDDKSKSVLDLKFKGVLSDFEIEKLKKLKISKVPVFDWLPPFIPFLSIGIIVSIFYSNLLFFFSF